MQRYMFSLRFKGGSSVPRGIRREIRDITLDKVNPIKGKRYRHEDDELIVDVKVRDITKSSLATGNSGFMNKDKNKLDKEYQWIIDSIIENGQIIKEEK